MERVVFLLPSSWHPGIRKRVRALQQEGIEATVLAFERSYHPHRTPPHDHTVLGDLENTRYWQRLWPFIKAIPAPGRSTLLVWISCCLPG